MTALLSRREFLKIAGSLAGAALLPAGAANFRGLPAAGRITPPNIILIVLDTVRAKSLSLFGYERPTSPQLAKLSKQGVLFTNAISASPWTLPSHASMFTGRWPNKLGVDWASPIENKFTLVTEVLRANGYQTAGFAANRIYCSREFGLAQGFDHFEDYRLTLGQMALSEALSNELLQKTRVLEVLSTNSNFGRKSAEMVNGGFLDWLQNRNSPQPFFAFLNYFDAHDPYLPPPEFATRYTDPAPNGHVTEEIQENPSDEDIRQLRDAYDSAVTYLDDQVGQLIQAISSSDWFENTLVILTSDHGEQFGEHNLLTHANSLYLELLHVFLILILPSKIPAGSQIGVPVSIRNIAATILDLAGLDNQGTIPGASLSRYWNGSKVEEMLYSFHSFGAVTTPQDIYSGVVESIIYQDLHYIQDSGGIKELYDLRVDRGEINNLVNTGRFENTVLTYQKYLRKVASSV